MRILPAGLAAQEVFFRGVLHGRLRESFDVIPAVLLSGAMFGLACRRLKYVGNANETVGRGLDRILQASAGLVVSLPIPVVRSEYYAIPALAVSTLTPFAMGRFLTSVFQEAEDQGSMMDLAVYAR